MKSIDWRLRPPFNSYLGSPLYPNGVDNPEQAMSEVINLMDEAEIAIGVCPFRKGMDNEDAERIYEAYPQRFKPLIHIDPWDGSGALDDITKYVVNGHAAGVIVEPGQTFIRKSMRADDPMMYPIYEKCEKENVLLTVTFGGMGTRDPGLYMPQFMAHVCDDFPKLKIVVAHGGWPWVAGICHVAYNHKFLYISPDAYMSRTQPAHQDYVAAAKGWLQDKMIFGTAYAYPMGDLKATVTEYTEQLPPEIAEKVLYHNAAGLLGLEPLKDFQPIG